MRAADGVGLLSAGGGLIALKRTNAALEGAGWSLRRAGRGDVISRPVRRQLTASMGLKGFSRAPSTEINRVVRQHLLEGAAGVVGLFASGYSGIGNEVGSGFWDLVVWITGEKASKR